MDSSMLPYDDTVDTTTYHVLNLQYPFYVIFSFWKVEGNLELLYSSVFLFLFGIGHEFFNNLQAKFTNHGLCTKVTKHDTGDDKNLVKQPKNDKQNICEQKTKSGKKANNEDGKCKYTCFPPNVELLLKHCVDTIVYCFMLMWSYVLMLSVMTMNPVIICSAVSGCTTGYFIFHKQKFSRKAEKTEKKMPNETMRLTNRQDSLMKETILR
ncbi:unnamed protein product [Clavelina lepadiformis]|uniref:Copper transport protein n=1 Tax=Clavelina lepadiformis TaxID=159417 RepID=A0ABP0EWR0_CLALP